MSEFTVDLNTLFDEKVTANIIEVQKKLALEALRRVVQKSPVDTGRFRGNWQVSLGVRLDGTLETVDPNGGATINKGVRPISTLDDLDIVYIQNNLPYAQRLEEGHSKQAPEGVVAITVAELTAFFNEVTK